MPGQHALLSPSAAYRWLHCTAAPRLEATVEDKDSVFAQEGTLAHAHCAYKLKTFLGLPVDDEIAEMAADDRYHTGEMDEYTDTYKSIVLEKFNAARAWTPDAQLLVEQRLDFSKYIPDAFGTADAIIIADGCMEVIDFKYGKGVRVDANRNPQMMIYALGAFERFSFDYHIDSVRMTIVQPRIDNLSEYRLIANDLLTWADTELTPKAEEAYSDHGKQLPGNWCQFCRVKNGCKALADLCLSTTSIADDPHYICKKDIEEKVLPRLALIKSWLSGIEDYALEQALAGVNYAGYKVVEGRSNRRITDTAAVESVLTGNGYDADAILRPQELRTITDLEKLVGKKQFAALCAEYIDKPQGKPALVPDSDKRPAFNAAAEDFKSINI